MHRDTPGERTGLIPAWSGWLVLGLLILVQTADRGGIVDAWGVAAVTLASAAAAVSTRSPVSAAGLVVGATLLNAAFPANVLVGLYGVLLWVPVVVGALRGARPLAAVVLAELAAAILLEYRASPLTPFDLTVRATILLMLFGGPGLAGLLLGRYWRIARGVETELRRDSELFRRALSRDLHDTAVHATTSMVMRANQALLRDDLDDQARRDFQFIADTGREATRTLRHTLSSLRETDAMTEAPSVDSTWFRARLHGEQARLEEAGFTVRATTEVALTDVPAAVLATLGRICTEVTNNVLRHGKPASEVTLMLENSGSALTLMCSNVRGPSDEGPGRTRLGVTGMTELAEAQGGTVTARPMGPHWVTHVSLPTSSKVR